MERKIYEQRKFIVTYTDYDEVERSYSEYDYNDLRVRLRFQMKYNKCLLNIHDTSGDNRKDSKREKKQNKSSEKNEYKIYTN